MLNPCTQARLASRAGLSRDVFSWWQPQKLGYQEYANSFLGDTNDVGVEHRESVKMVPASSPGSLERVVVSPLMLVEIEDCLSVYGYEDKLIGLFHRKTGGVFQSAISVLCPGVRVARKELSVSVIVL